MNSADIMRLIDRKVETANIDFKEGFKWHKDNRDLQYELIRDLIAMANTRDGGTIILGVEDGTYNLVGVDQETLDSFDITDVARLLHKYATPKVTIQLTKPTLAEKSVVAINVTEFEDVPIVCSETLKDQRNIRVILRRSALYIRTAAATTEEIASDQEMRELLGRALIKKGDQLLSNIEQVLKGKVVKPTAPTIDLYGQELRSADEWFKEKLQKGFLASGHWEFIIHPSDYTSDRIPTIGRLEEILQKSTVSLRGWPFPYLRNAHNTSNFNSGFQGFIDSNDIRDAFRLYKSGLFVFKRALWEDLRTGHSPGTNLSFISAIYSITEWMVFSQRFAENLTDVESFRITVRLVGAKARKLASYDAMVNLLATYQSDEAAISTEKDIVSARLRAAPMDLAQEIIKHIFEIFNWSIPTETIEFWQNKLLTLRG